MITTQIHGYVDYLMGIILILLPFLFDFPDGAVPIFVALGAGTIIYSLLTDYELGLVRILPMKIHLVIDLVVGVFLIVSPWIFGFTDELLWTLVILGILEVLVSLLTAKKARYPNPPKT